MRRKMPSKRIFILPKYHRKIKQRLYAKIISQIRKLISQINLLTSQINKLLSQISKIISLIISAF